MPGRLDSPASARQLSALAARIYGCADPRIYWPVFQLPTSAAMRSGQQTIYSAASDTGLHCTQKIRRIRETAFRARKTGRKAAAIQTEAWTVEHCVLIYADGHWTPRLQNNCGTYRCGSLIHPPADTATAPTAILCRSGASRDQAFSCSIHPIGCCLGAPFYSCLVLGAK